MNERRSRVETETERLLLAIRSRGGTAADDLLVEPPRVRLEEVAQHSRVSAHWWITTDIPIVTRLVVLWRRIMRLMLRWYINPIVEQQNAFNEATLRALRDLHAENEALRMQLARTCQSRQDEAP